ncbi:uncharacterized protein UV8b_04238 [Ustilaginoidea virens]|uniref:SRP54-type proteins GTP-binding domain-containing protein n=1 Tax=Ustilaginoidea virens TaxID=1159556 RepID=A0A8E5MHI9_USTVR|nr:uncharacterized protein UV8b_04238 [Ustilaginoidea virens]QUC19997.1 hypothetical protein UV8b_04238 [Ustilaginoidea virens]
MSLQVADDKAAICLSFILEHVQRHKAASPRRPLIVGLNGMQGVGKTTLVASLALALEGKSIKTLVFSLDDLYLTRQDQVEFASANAGNALVQHRGEPGTHDVDLARSIFASLVEGQPTSIPRFDKALFQGHGDRLPREQWRRLNQPGDEPTEVIIFEGWSVGFRPISAESLEAKWEAPSRTLRKHNLEHLLFVNERLAEYDGITEYFDVFIHLDSEDADSVYAWRQEQEHSLRAARGDPDAGMTPEQVTRFVDGYYPAYELYTEGVRSGIFAERPGRQLRIVVGRDRRVKHVVRL